MAKLGTGERFAALVSKFKTRGNVRDPRALAASIGAKKYGRAKMEQMAEKGRK